MSEVHGEEVEKEDHEEEDLVVLTSLPSHTKKRWHFDQKKEFWSDILTFLDSLDEPPWEARSKLSAWGTVAMQVNLQDYAQGYSIGARALERWFNSLMSIELQQFLGTWRRSGEGDGGPPPDVPEELSELFTSLKGKVEAGKKSKAGDKKEEKRNSIVRAGIAANGRLGAQSPEFDIDESGEPRLKKRRQRNQDNMADVIEYLDRAAERRAEAQSAQNDLLRQLLQNQMLLMQRVLNPQPPCDSMNLSPSF